MGLAAFFRAHLLPSIIMTVGVVWAAIGFVSQAYDIWTAGLQPWAVQLTGFLVFVAGVISLLYRMYHQNEQFLAKASLQSTAEPKHRSPSLAQARDQSANAHLGEEPRNILDPSITPSSLVSLGKNRTEIQALHAWEPYVGQWMHVSGFIAEVGQDSSTITVLVSETPETYSSTAHLTFPVTHSANLFLKNRGDPIQAIGKIRRFSTLGYIDLEQCELVSTLAS